MLAWARRLIFESLLVSQSSSSSAKHSSACSAAIPIRISFKPTNLNLQPFKYGILQGGDRRSIGRSDQGLLLLFSSTHSAFLNSSSAYGATTLSSECALPMLQKRFLHKGLIF